jgi:hypothetical protein
VEAIMCYVRVYPLRWMIKLTYTSRETKTLIAIRREDGSVLWPVQTMTQTKERKKIHRESLAMQPRYYIDWRTRPPVKTVKIRLYEKPTDFLYLTEMFIECGTHGEINIQDIEEQLGVSACSVSLDNRLSLEETAYLVCLR